MKKKILIILLVVICVFLACVIIKTVPNNNDNTVTATWETNTKEEMENEMNTINKTIIAEAIGINPENRSIRFILNSLNIIEAGTLQSAQLKEYEEETILDIIAEDGTAYRMYLSSGGSVEAVKNLDTRQWVIQSEK